MLRTKHASEPASPTAAPWWQAAVSSHLQLGTAVLLVVLIVVAYQPALHAGFVWDDDVNLTANPTVRDLAGLRQMWFVPEGWYQYYPLTFSSFSIEYHLWGLN